MAYKYVYIYITCYADVLTKNDFKEQQKNSMHVIYKSILVLQSHNYVSNNIISSINTDAENCIVHSFL